MPITQEAIAKLTERFPEEVVEKRKNPGGKITSFIDVDILEDRINDVDLGWGKDIRTGEKAVEVHYTICGIRRGATADLEDAKGGYGTPAKNAEASASRRALRKFGIGAYLWSDNETSTETYNRGESKSSGQSSNRSSGNGKSSGKGPVERPGKSGATPGQMKYMTGGWLRVPVEIADALTKDQVKDLLDILKPMSESKDDYRDRPEYYINRALSKAGIDLDADEDEEDEDED